MIPIHKDGDHEVASNNRPISLLAALSKVCNKVVLNQFTAYLTERKLVSNYGIPQGSVLSPFLFNIYADSLSLIPDSCSLKSYMDDSKEYLSFSLTILDHFLSIPEEDLHRVHVFEWCCKNSLLINADKTKMMVIGSQQLLQQLDHIPRINFIGKPLNQWRKSKIWVLFLTLN